ncbi:MAG: SMP-30/gluconolactonase/LRE family protein [Acidobacteria bacterium]|nr:SMP-30/gluconolactonase/LRE family protein [Acidobacteriota bacterium]
MSRYRRIPVLLLPVLLLTIASLPSAASGPAFWTVATAADLLKGTSDGVYVSLSGVVTPGPALTNRMTTTPAQIWSVARAQDGTIWAGTGGDGRVVRLRPGQATEETVFDAPEANIFAVAISGSRTYAASSPEGKVYVIEGDTPARVFFDPTENYIWALAVDRTGRLWVGAGNPAVIYRVAPDGTSQIVSRPPATHVVSLALDGNGRMMAGTESPGRLYRFNDNDQPFVLLDTGLAELRAMTVAGNVTYAAGIAKGEETASAGETTSVAVTLAATATTGAPPASGSAPARRSVIYRIDPSGSWEEIWTTPDLVYDLAAQPDDGVLLATGPEGRLYKISPDLDVFLFTGVDARQITRFAANGTEVSAFTTANPGRVVAIGTGAQSAARYLSSVLDTKSVATWGIIRWDGTPGVELFTRSGNTQRPDDSWSEWSGPYRQRGGEAVSSPTARFVQWRAVFTRSDATPSPSLSAVTLAYLPRNNRPVVSSITLYPSGVVFQRPFVNDDSAIAGLDDITIEARRPTGEEPPAAPALNRRMMQKGLQTIAWKGEDPDGDQLLYTLQHRRDGDAEWRDLRTGLTGTIFVWDTSAVPDGRYFVRVRASDAPSNAGDRALIGGRESDAIDVDNTPPALEITPPSANQPLAIVARDARSAIARLEYSVRGGEWQLVYPVDGLADGPEERYTIALPSGVTAADVVVRVMDRLQNVASRPAAAP